ncbi:hypothetical protein NW062_03430 [Mycoplasmopsis cynos]|nr:hypothetical protein NW062_03430 [Mycoplasmopsis cynos]
MLVEPNVSTAGKALIITFSFTIFATPIANKTVVKVIKPSGIAATASEIPTIKALEYVSGRSHWIWN